MALFERRRPDCRELRPAKTRLALHRPLRSGRGRNERLRGGSVGVGSRWHLTCSRCYGTWKDPSRARAPGGSGGSAGPAVGGRKPRGHDFPTPEKQKAQRRTLGLCFAWRVWRDSHSRPRGSYARFVSISSGPIRFPLSQARDGRRVSDPM